jgi:membrane protein implicated in regulation of membrane protease activity
MDALWGTVTYWHWWALGLALVVVEMVAPGVFFLWLGIAAGLVGFMLLAAPDLSWQTQVLSFAVLSVVSVAAGRWILKRHPIHSDEPRLNRRGEQYVGRVFTLEQPIVNGQGKIRVDDSTWKVEGADCASGTRVRVVGVDGVVLRIEPAG